MLRRIQYSLFGDLDPYIENTILGKFWNNKLDEYVKKNGEKIATKIFEGDFFKGKKITDDKREDMIKRIHEDFSLEIGNFFKKILKENGIYKLKTNNDDEKIEIIEKVLKMNMFSPEYIPDIKYDTIDPKVFSKEISEIREQVIRPAIQDHKKKLEEILDDLKKKEELNDEFTNLLPRDRKSKTSGGKSKKRNKRNKKRNTHTRRKMKPRK